MNIVSSQLKQIIKEEIKRILSEEERRATPERPIYRRVTPEEPSAAPPDLEASNPMDIVVSPTRGIEQGRLGMASPEDRAQFQRMQQQGYDFETRTFPEDRTPQAIAGRERRREVARGQQEAYLQGDEALAAYNAQYAPDRRPPHTVHRRPATPEDIARLGGPGGQEVLPGIIVRGRQPTTPTSPPTAVAAAERGRREQERPLTVARSTREPASYASSHVPIGGEQAAEYATSINELIDHQIDRYLNNIK